MVEAYWQGVTSKPASTHHVIEPETAGWRKLRLGGSGMSVKRWLLWAAIAVVAAVLAMLSLLGR